jgi:hypothetical protein
MSNPQITRVVDQNGERDFSAGMTVVKPFGFKGTDSAGHGGGVNVNGPSFNSLAWTIDDNGNWYTDNLTPFINGTYEVYAVCSTTQTQSTTVAIEVT